LTSFISLERYGIQPRHMQQNIAANILLHIPEIQSTVNIKRKAMDLLSAKPADRGRIRQASLAASRAIEDTGCTSESNNREPRWELAMDRLLGVHDQSRSYDYRMRVCALDHYGASRERLLDLWLLAHGGSAGGHHPSVLLVATKSLLGLLGLLVVAFLILSVDRLLR
jgi:hypothetical protein